MLTQWSNERYHTNRHGQLKRATESNFRSTMFLPAWPVRIPLTFFAGDYFVLFPLHSPVFISIIREIDNANATNEKPVNATDFNTLFGSWIAGAGITKANDFYCAQGYDQT